MASLTATAYDADQDDDPPSTSSSGEDSSVGSSLKESLEEFYQNEGLLPSDGNLFRSATNDTDSSVASDDASVDDESASTCISNQEPQRAVALADLEQGRVDLWGGQGPGCGDESSSGSIILVLDDETSIDDSDADSITRATRGLSPTTEEEGLGGVRDEHTEELDDMWVAPFDNDDQGNGASVDTGEDLDHLAKNEGINVDLHKRYLNYRKNPPPPLHEEDTAGVELLALLYRARAQIYLYDEIMKWAKTYARTKVFEPDNVKMIPNRKAAVRAVRKRYDMTGYQPKVTRITLPNAKVNVPITTFDLYEAVYSLLSDNTIMTDTNLVFPDEFDPTVAPEKWEELDDDHVVDELPTGMRYISTYHARCKDNEGRDVLCPLIIFTDKTHCDEKGKLCAEPVYVTLGILSTAARQQPYTWRVIGYVPQFVSGDSNLGNSGDPDQNDSSSEDEGDNYSPEIDKSSTGKQSDYHFILQHIFRQMYTLHEKGAGIRWDIRYKGKVYKTVLRMPLLYTTGDHQGQDKICGRFLTYSKVEFLCRMCSTPSPYNGLSTFPFRLVCSRPLAELARKAVKDGDKEAADLMRRLSRHCLSHGNAFDKIDFGSNEANLGGINQNSPSDPLHTGDLGWSMDVKDALFSEHKLCPQGRMLELARVVGKDKRAIYAEKQKVRVFSDQFNRVVDSATMYWARELAHQSDRTLARCPTGQGVTQTTKLAGHEQPLTLILLSLYLSSALGTYHLASPTMDRGKKEKKFPGIPQGLMGSERLADYIWLCEEVVLLTHYIRGPLTKGFLQGEFLEYMCGMVQRYNKTTTGDGTRNLHKLKKHCLLHICSHHVMFGNASNRNTDVGELGHKDSAKDTSKNTQKRRLLFDQQNAQGYSDNLSLRRMSRSSEVASSSTAASEGVADDKDFFDHVFLGSDLVLDDRRGLCVPVIAERDGKRDVELERVVVLDTTTTATTSKFLGDILCPSLTDQQRDGLQFHRKMKFQGNWYKGDPLFNNQPPRSKGWFDWCSLQPPQGKHLINAHILVFVTIPKPRIPIKQNCCSDIRGELESMGFGDLSVDSAGTYILCHIVEGALQHPTHNQWPNEQTRLLRKGVKLHRTETTVVGRTKNRKGRGKSGREKIIEHPPHVFMVPVWMLKGPVMAVRDLNIHPKDKTLFVEDPLHYLFIVAKDTWRSEYTAFIEDAAITDDEGSNRGAKKRRKLSEKDRQEEARVRKVHANATKVERAYDAELRKVVRKGKGYAPFPSDTVRRDGLHRNHKSAVRMARPKRSDSPSDSSSSGDGSRESSESSSDGSRESSESSSSDGSRESSTLKDKSKRKSGRRSRKVKRVLWTTINDAPVDLTLPKKRTGGIRRDQDASDLDTSSDEELFEKDDPQFGHLSQGKDISSDSTIANDAL